MKSRNIYLDYTGLFVPGGVDENSFEKGMEEGENILTDLSQELKAGSVPFHDMVFDDNHAENVHSTLKDVEDADTLIVIGIGGSSLGAAALESALSKPSGREIRFLDNIDPDLLTDILTGLDLEKTAVNVVSKSGQTLETLANFLIIEEIFRKSNVKSENRMIVTTDGSGTVLNKVAQEKGYAVLPMPVDVGGRFSVLTSAGLFPAAFSGLDTVSLIEGARSMAAICGTEKSLKNPAFISAWVCHHLDRMKNKNIQIIMPYSDALLDAGHWFCQLWSESLGKKFNLDGQEVFAGQTPVVARGASDQHSQLQLYTEGPKNKMVCFLEVEEFANDYVIPAPEDHLREFEYLGGVSLQELMRTEKRATEYALRLADCPTMTISFPVLNEYLFGQYIVMSEFQTIIAGKLYGVNPYGQPGVENGKRATASLLGKKGQEDYRSELEGYFLKKRRTV